jgi:para-nitrobenzyl esterase
VTGQVSDGIAAFKGIPYAAPPSGERRFGAPEPPEPGAEPPEPWAEPFEAFG